MIRILHFIGDARDVTDACAAIKSRSAADGAHWLLASGFSDSPVDIPANAEWIRLPTNSNRERSWLEAVRTLVSALEPERLVIHAAFERLHPDRIAALNATFPTWVTPARDLFEPAAAPAHRAVGYVLKKFPRYSETFILREVLALEELGTPVQVYSLNPPLDGRFHHLLGRLQHSVEYLPPVARGKALQGVADIVPSDMRETFQRYQWELIDRSRQDLFSYLAHAVHIALSARERGIGHLHAHFATSASETARMAAGLAGITYSFTTHAKDMYAETVDRPGFDQSLADSRFAVTVCGANESFLQRTHPVHADRVRVLYNGIQLDEVASRRESSDDRPLILAVGRYVEKKGFDLLLQALAQLKRERVVFRARILGDGEMFDEIRQLRTDLGLEEDVDMPGAASMEQVKSAMAEAAILVCPSKIAANGDKDALPTVLLEAMAASVPCVGTDVGGIAEILDEGRAGLLVEPDARSLADGMTRLVRSDKARRDLGTIARRRAEDMFDIRRNVGTLQAWFDEAAHAPSPNGSGSRASGRHVLILSQDAGIAWDSPKGAAVHLRSMARSALDAGLSPSVFVQERLARTWRDGVPAFEAVAAHGSTTRYFKGRATDDEGASFGRELAALARNAVNLDAILELHRDRPIDLIYERYSLWSDAGAQAAKELGIPYVVEVNAPLIEEQLRFRTLHLTEEARAIEKRVLTSADRVVVVSRLLRRRVVDLGVPADRVVVLPNVADARRFACRDYRPRAAREPFTIGFSGALKPWHGLTQFIDVFRRVHEQRPHVRFEVLGDSKHREKLEADIAALGLADAVTFHGHVDHDRVPEYLAGWDLVVAPYPAMDDFYFSPLKIAEAMAAGRPIMATDIGDIAEMLGNGVHGILIPAGAWAEWEGALLEVIDDPARLVSIAASAKREASTWSWENHVQVSIGDMLQPVTAG